jgi:peptidase YpeB-like protein
MKGTKVVIAAAMALGVAGGSYGIASAASGNSASSTGALATAPAAPSTDQPWGGQRSDETPLTGDALAKVTAVAQAQVPGGTIVRVETDADGNARYEAHMTKADGTPVTVYVDANFGFVKVATRP